MPTEEALRPLPRRPPTLHRYERRRRRGGPPLAGANCHRLMVPMRDQVRGTAGGASRLSDENLLSPALNTGFWV
jgi:hypothetical protein